MYRQNALRPVRGSFFAPEERLLTRRRQVLPSWICLDDPLSIFFLISIIIIIILFFVPPFYVISLLLISFAIVPSTYPPLF